MRAKFSIASSLRVKHLKIDQWTVRIPAFALRAILSYKNLKPELVAFYWHLTWIWPILTGRFTALRPLPHLQFYCAILSLIAVRNCVCRTLQLCCINENWPISVHRIFARKLHRTQRYSIRNRSCATVEKLRDTLRHVTLRFRCKIK